MIEVLDDYEMLNGMLHNHVERALEGWNECGIWRLVTLYWVLSTNPEYDSMSKRCTNVRLRPVLDESLKREREALNGKMTYREIWMDAVEEDRGRFYEGVRRAKEEGVIEDSGESDEQLLFDTDEHESPVLARLWESVCTLSG